MGQMVRSFLESHRLNQVGISNHAGIVHGACIVLSPPASQAAAYQLRSAQSNSVFDIVQRVRTGP